MIIKSMTTTIFFNGIWYLSMVGRRLLVDCNICGCETQILER